ncbi:MAG: hypothetical protein PHH08_00360 [Candidatus ainarchaeum sp.]|nr:hypothetical protein [Candidatus ainarchaeum sp.]
MKLAGKLLLKPEDFQPSFPNWTVQGALNPAAVRLENKKIVLIARISEAVAKKDEIVCPVIISESHYHTSNQKIGKKDILKRIGNGVFFKNGTCRLTNISEFRKILLDETGMNIERIEQKPVFTGTHDEGEYGIEDPRITVFHRKYLMTYVAVSHNEGVSTCLAVSKNLHDWKRQGIIFREQNKDVVIFPEKINGKFVALHRPEGSFHFSRPSVWISYSPDLVYWGREKSIVQPRDNSWESERIGSGTVPLKTKEGWLEIYHGVRKKGKRKIYSAGAFLLDLKNPEKIIARTPASKPLIEPEEEYEKHGFVSNVVFPSGAVPDLNGADLLLYCGGGDRAISVKKIGLKDILNSMEYY